MKNGFNKMNEIYTFDHIRDDIIAENLTISSDLSELFFLFFCQMSYFAPGQLDDIITQVPNLKSYVRMHTGKAISVIYQFEDMAVVTFRGLKTVQDLVRSLNFIPEDYRGTRVHRGFAEATQELNDLGIIPMLAKQRERYDKVIYTGHSLGGAIANILSLDVPPDKLITFGSPKVISKPKSVFENTEIIRYVTKYDFIRYVPPNLPYMYKHIGDGIILPGSFYIKELFRPHRISEYIKSVVSHNGGSELNSKK